MAPYANVLASNYKWKPINKRLAKDKRWKDQGIIQRRMGLERDFHLADRPDFEADS
jgi:transposase